MRHLIRKTRHRIVGWSLLDICAGLAGLLSATLLSLWLLNKLGVSITAMKSLVLGWLVVGVAFLVLKLRDLLKAFQSFHHLCRFIEDATPAYHNDLSTLDYLQRNMPEVHRYGFSQDLIAALKNSVEHLPEPDWPALGLTWPAHRRPALCAAGGWCFSLFWWWLMAPLSGRLPGRHSSRRASPARQELRPFSFLFLSRFH
ncbi:MAG: hypothetical protein UZ16_OP3001002124 [Candidatus Hinthialibacteria bacterium OLB16]|nr:MAG: hypothetical protein UZ16_OP3001002124 [Candidatus Hinthialibacteria bacterium OLB16]